MKVLVACERYGLVRDAFIAKGHDAISCDIEDTVAPGPHFKGPLEKLLYGAGNFDLIIAFPPCTHLAVSGAKHFAAKRADGRQQGGIDFFMSIANASCDKIAIENPIGIMSTVWRTPDQIIQPWQFGEEFSKSTCLWLKNLPLLKPTKIVGKGSFVIHGGKKLPTWYSNRQRDRDKTFEGIANAMAEQWG